MHRMGRNGLWQRLLRRMRVRRLLDPNPNPKEIVGAVQQDHRGLGWRKGTQWSKKNKQGRHDMVTDELRHMEEERWVSLAVW